MKSRKKLPISRHPLFPAMVCLWFAALFGLGSLAIRPSLLENAVLALHIDTLVPAAAPPLGITARIILALAMFAVGAVIGLVLGLRIALPKVAKPVRSRAEVQVQDVWDDGDNDDLDRLEAARADQASAVIPGRRRALAMEEDYERPYSDSTPLSQSVTQAAAPELAAPEVTAVVEGVHIHSLDPRILDLADISVTEQDEEPVEAEPVAAQVALARAFDGPVAASEPEEVAPVAQAPVAQAPVAQAPVAQAPIATPILRPMFQLPRDGAEKLRAAPIESLGIVQLAERLALAIARRRDGVTAAAAMTAALPPRAPEPEPEPAPEAPVATLAIAPLAEPQAEVQDLGTPPPMPAALRPISFHAIDDEDEAVESLLPPRRFAMPAPVASAPEVASARDQHEPAALPETPTTDDALENGYGSLLAVKPVRLATVWADETGHDEAVAQDVAEPAFDAEQIEDVGDEPEVAEAAPDIEPVVIFPGHAQFAAPPAEAAPTFGAPLSSSGLRRFDAPSAAPTQLRPAIAAPADPLETERALKAALATLQRMSGAA
ncbi:MAG: hypothetical protein ABI673_07625 [Novosphingobium sp.]